MNSPAAPPASLLTSSQVYRRGVALCLVATVMSGLMFPVMTHALRYLDPFTFTSLRYAFASLAFLLLLRYREGPGLFQSKGHSLWGAWLLGSIGFCGFGSLVFLGQQLAGPQGALNASIMMATQPMMGMLINALVKRKAPAAVSLMLVVVSFFGVSLVITHGHLLGALQQPQHYAASLLILGGALCWVVYTYCSSYFTGWSALRYTTMTTSLGLTSIVAINIVLVTLHWVPTPTLHAVSAIGFDLLYMGPIAGFAAILFWVSGNRILGAVNGVLFMDVVPITAFVASAIVGVVPAPIQVLGAALTAGALILNNLYLRQRALRVTVAAA